MAQVPTPIDQLPGFRRRIHVAPQSGVVDCELEDDYHRMHLSLHHDGVRATGVDASMPRAPWTTCPGATGKLRQTFNGVLLAQFAARGDKRQNCTHLHDMAVIAAAHAHDQQPLTYDILVSDPVNFRRHAEIRRNGVPVLAWVDESKQGGGYNTIVAPAALAGKSLDQLRTWIQSLSPAQRESARMLQWCAILANGRRLSIAEHADIGRLVDVGRCYTLDPRRLHTATRNEDIRDFSQGTAVLLARAL